MTEVELNGLDEIGEYLDQRDLYIGAHMIKRRQDETEGERSEPTSYLAMAVSDPGLGRFGVKPMVTGADAVALPAGGPWAGDVVGQEPPLGFSIEELPALGGASEPPLRCVEVSTEAVASDGGQQR
jgi:hypothetical protein